MTKDMIEYSDFAKIEMRIAEVKQVLPFERARNPSYKVEVDVPGLGTRWSSAQITSYEPNELVGRQVVCVVNMPSRNIAGFQSEVLILGAKNSNGDVIVLQPEADVITGGEIL